MGGKGGEVNEEKKEGENKGEGNQPSLNLPLSFSLGGPCFTTDPCLFFNG